MDNIGSLILTGWLIWSLYYTQSSPVKSTNNLYLQCTHILSAKFTVNCHMAWPSRHPDHSPCQVSGWWLIDWGGGRERERVSDWLVHLKWFCWIKTQKGIFPFTEVIREEVKLLLLHMSLYLFCIEINPLVTQSSVSQSATRLPYFKLQ